jgi:hypothetical protein
MARTEARRRALAGPAPMARMETGRRALAGPTPTASVGSRAAAGPGLTERRAAGPRIAGLTRARCPVLGHPMPAVGAAAARHGAPTSQAGTVNGEAAGGPLCGGTRRRVLVGRAQAGSRVRSLMATADAAARHGGRNRAGSNAPSLMATADAAARHGGRNRAGSNAPGLMTTADAAARHDAPTGRAGTVNGEAAGGPLCGGTRRRVPAGRTRAGRRVPCGATRRRVPVGTAPANGDVLPRRWTGRSYTMGHDGARTVGFLS